MNSGNLHVKMQQFNKEDYYLLKHFGKNERPKETMLVWSIIDLNSFELDARLTSMIILKDTVNYVVQN